eukprot:TRINITY_DN2758_c0_g1_i1.p1 TRINITY_DN2758_c0_g1~~TRINITY_DN2758_c0_g1_i1.p1  ORF type:complete len:268 (-),score=10.96 TRINITY_DN2758_c0_g1_i1:25-828(-)
MEYLDKVQDYIDNFTFHDAPLSSFYAPAIGGVLYLTVIFSLRTQVKTGAPYKVFTIIHNLFLCLLSLLMMLGILLNIVMIGRKKGFFYVYCDDPSHPLGTMEKGAVAFWCYVFYASKYYEMIDTLLLVLKKRPLTLVHCYHHFIVPFLFWGFLETGTTAHWFLCVANCAVHVLMYYYYMIRTMGHDVWWKKYLTQLQIIQFFFDMLSTWPALIMMKGFGLWQCQGQLWTVIFGQLVGLSFIFLFTSFYLQTYNSEKTKKLADNKKRE